jgi:sugar lactone lactonase YvrE/cephalosporin-C deacetylase-like acetyl esterase
MSRFALLTVPLLVAVPVHAADDVPPNKQYQAFVIKQAAELRKNDKAPESLDAWKTQAAELRKNLLAAWGGFPEKPCDLDPQQHGEPLKREGYTVEKLTFQTRPGVRMTANLYVPDAAKTKKAPAILMVHGHWRGAKQDPTVQSRCIGAAKLGFVVLCVDAFGAGERGVGTALGEYHGDMTAATLLPLGTPLSGLQVYENMRAVDYLETRPEVDKDRIGITGASGGGNQTMYAGAWDERFKCVVPVCSVGNYQAYLQTACCMCEVVPGALKFTEEWAVLALTAPRALMVVNATKDGIQFSVGEARKSLTLTGPVYKLFGKPDNLRHAVFEGPHDYSKPMREAMYGFMTLHLKGEGNGDPIPEPKFTTENPEDLRCFPGDTRPKDFMTIPKFAAAEGKKLQEAADGLISAEKLWDTRGRLARSLGEETNGIGPIGAQAKNNPDGSRTLQWNPAPGVTLTGLLEPGTPGVTVVLINMNGAEAARKGKFYAAAKRAGVRIATFDLRATGPLSPDRNRVGRAPDHNSAEWALWLGRPLFNQWLRDTHSFVRAIIEVDTVYDRSILYVGEGPAGLLAVAASGTAQNAIERGAVMIDSPVTLVTDKPFEKQWLGLISPGFLREFGDVPHLAALGAITPLAVVGGTDAQGAPLTDDALRAAFKAALDSAKRSDVNRRVVFSTPEKVLAALGAVAAEEYGDSPIFAPGARLTKLSEDGAGGEGPAWDPKLGVLTSGAKGIHQLTPDGKKLIFREKAGTNGLLFDRDGNLVCCEPVSRSVSRITPDGKRTVLTDAFGGKKYNQPNDLTIDSKNRIYFSDPRYGPRDDMQQRDAEGKTIEGVYRIDPDGKVHRVIGREVDRANGVLVSADDKYLFVADNNNGEGGARKLWRFDLKADGTVDLKSQKLLYDWGKGRGPDGIKQDADGRLYVAGGLNKPNPPAEPATDVKGGIYVIDPETGKLLAFLAVPTDEVTNCAFGGNDRKTLYITGGGTLYGIRTTTAGRVIWPAKP